MNSNDFWIWLLVCYMIFAGITSGVLAWTAAFRVAQARWTPVINRLGHSTLAFSPILLLLLLVLLGGAERYMPWVLHPVPEKSAWLNVPFLIIREIVCTTVLFVLCFFMVRWGLKTDAKRAQGESITNSDQYKITAISTVSIMFYTIASSIMTYDFIMSLSPEWVSTMFAPYCWITNMYAGMAVLILISTLVHNSQRVGRHLGTQQFQDMGNLLLGFSLFSMGLFFAQYLTIWYENIPVETQFLIIRYDKGMWPYLGWTALIIGYAIPFILLQSRRLKRDPRMLSPVALLVILGVMLERYTLIVPSIKPDSILLNPLGLLSILALAGVFVASIIWFLKRYPLVSSADEALHESDFILEITK